MGVIKQGILGGFSGKVANVVGSSWKGIAVLKSLPLSVANPKTAGQVAQRGAMTSIVAASRLLLAALIQPYWNPFAQKQSGYNKFVSENIATFTTAGFVTFGSFFSMRGSLLGVVTSGGSASAGSSTITLNWTDNSGTSDALATDDMVVTVYNETQDYWTSQVAGDTRDAESNDITDANMAQNDELHVYVGMSRPDISKVADSFYEAITVGA